MTECAMFKNLIVNKLQSSLDTYWRPLVDQEMYYDPLTDFSGVDTRSISVAERDACVMKVLILV